MSSRFVPSPGAVANPRSTSPHSAYSNTAVNGRIRRGAKRRVVSARRCAGGLPSAPAGEPSVSSAGASTVPFTGASRLAAYSRMAEQTGISAVVAMAIGEDMSCTRKKMRAASRYEAIIPKSEKRAPRRLYRTLHASTSQAVVTPVTRAPMVASTTATGEAVPKSSDPRGISRVPPRVASDERAMEERLSAYGWSRRASRAQVMSVSAWAHAAQFHRPLMV